MTLITPFKVQLRYNKSQIRIINQYIANSCGILYRKNRENEKDYDYEDTLNDEICVDFGLTIDQIAYSGTEYESPYDKLYLKWILDNYEFNNNYI